jgi:exosortase
MNRIVATGFGPRPQGLKMQAMRHWPLLLGIAALALPTLLSLARQHWSTEGGGHGPIILATGLWLLWRERGRIAAEAAPLPFWPIGVLTVPLLILYLFGRTFNVLSVESGSLYALLVLLALLYWGPALVRRLWFPIFYLAFLISPPGSLLAEFTQPLKIWISGMAADTLYAFGYPVGQSGATIQIAQYELIVEQACAGLNSLITLVAIGLFYVHLNRSAGLLHSALLVAAIIPIAILANFLRVVGLALLTYHMGDGVAQGFSHDLAGVTTFILAMAGLFAVDSAIALVRSGSQRTSR